MTLSPTARPPVVAISNSHGFTHLVRTLLGGLDLAVRSTAVNESAVHLVEDLLPDLVILDLVPGQETECWLVMEALKARPSTRAIPLLLCPAVSWLLDGHRERLTQHGVRTWCNPFDLRDLLGELELACDRSACLVWPVSAPTQPL